MLPLQEAMETLLTQNEVLRVFRESKQALRFVFQNGTKMLQIERREDCITIAMSPKWVFTFKSYWSNPSWCAENCTIDGVSHPMHVPFNEKTYFSAGNYLLFLKEADALVDVVQEGGWVLVENYSSVQSVNSGLTEQLGFSF